MISSLHNVHFYQLYHTQIPAKAEGCAARNGSNKDDVNPQSTVTSVAWQRTLQRSHRLDNHRPLLEYNHKLNGPKFQRALFLYDDRLCCKHFHEMCTEVSRH
jgi:hypothetical protein